MSDIEVILTNDGSHSLFNKLLNETYHSVHGAVQESIHVFIKNGVEHYTESSNVSALKILEVGFGTGLNTFLTFEWAHERNCSIQYTAIEPHPLEADVWSKLNYARSSQTAADYFAKLHQLHWDLNHELTSQFSFLKRSATLQDVILPLNFYNVVYFDAFAPSKQPELWTRDMLSKVCTALIRGGIFVTYSAKGQVKRDLASLGMMVETIPGPPGKKEMIRASKQ